MMASGVLKSIHDNRQHKLGHEQHQKGRQGTLVLLSRSVLRLPLSTSRGSSLAQTETTT